MSASNEAEKWDDVLRRFEDLVVRAFIGPSLTVDQVTHTEYRDDNKPEIRIAFEFDDGSARTMLITVKAKWLDVEVKNVQFSD